jgi:hypothetical protein
METAMQRTTRLALVGAATILFQSAAALAGALTVAPPLEAPSLIVLVHGCHGSANVESDRGGPHYHAEGCRRVNGYPAWDPRSHRYDGSVPSYGRRSYGYGYGDYSGGSCWSECRYSGAPREVCRRMCR